HGDLEDALAHYKRSLEEYRAAADAHGCALAFHNLGMASRYQGLWDAAERYYAHSLEIAQASGDLHLQGLCLVHRAEAHIARQRYEAGRRDAEAGLAIFDQIGARSAKVDAYRVIGMMYRETGRAALAESRLKSAIELAMRTGSILGEAEATRELALLSQVMRRNQEALTLLTAAHRLFRRLAAPVALVHVAGKRASLEFPWDIKPIIRQHHEKYDGTGYPDRLRGDEIPLAAQLVCIVDVYDALRSARPYRGAMSHDTAIKRMAECSTWWKPEVYAAFGRALGRAADAALYAAQASSPASPAS